MSTVRAAQQTQTAQRVGGAKVPCYVFDSDRDLACSVARSIAAVIRERNSYGHDAVLGLPTGLTPVGVYRELIRLHEDDGLDFSGVVTFNIDEYYGLSPEQPQSFHRWMHETFFDHVNVPARNINLPSGASANGSDFTSAKVALAMYWRYISSRSSGSNCDPLQHESLYPL